MRLTLIEKLTWRGFIKGKKEKKNTDVGVALIV